MPPTSPVPFRRMTRRQFLATVAAVAAATGLPQARVATALGAPAASTHPGGEHTTLAQTLRAGPAGALGYRPVVTGPGEPHVLRDELVPADPDRAGRRRSLLCLLHLTDQHIIDVQSPSRVEFLDRFEDGACDVGQLTSAWRPHEPACARLGDAMLRRARQVGFSPVTGAPIAAAVCTGDNTDNQQANELDVFLGVMDGGRVTPQSGNPDRYEGVQSLGDLGFWHPDPAVGDRYKTQLGFPARPGWLEQALAPFEAVGAGIPWYSAFGNHDGLAQGNAPANPAFEAIGTGPLKVVGPPATGNPCTLAEGLAGLPAGPAAPVAADAGRRYVSRAEWIAAHLDSPGLPRGHGFSQANVAEARAYYAADVGPLRWIVLDTVNPGGLSTGSIGQAQLDWLEARLAEAQEQRRLVLLFSHHGPRSLDNPLQQPDPLDPAGGDSPRHNAEQVQAVVGRFPCVIAWVNGHTHRNVVELQRGEHSAYWDIGTAAHIDWPAQSRMVEVVDNADGTLSIFGTMLDMPLEPVVDFALELMGNDPQKGFGAGQGAAEDRNVELLLPHPFPEQAAHADAGVLAPVAAPAPTPAATPGAVTSAPALPATGLPPGLTIGGALLMAGAMGVSRLRAAAEARPRPPRRPVDPPGMTGMTG
jgi:metallophosphoesterase (TIGR03767 family)